jgi:PII-like signaling protein
MSLIGEQVLLRIYLESADRPPHEPTYLRIVKAARAQGLAGCTVLRGVYGVGTRGLLAPSTWSVVQHLPVIVEIVDRPARIGTFVDGALCDLVTNGLATLERAAVIVYRHGATAVPQAPRSPPAARVPPLTTLPPIQPRPHMTVDDNGMLLRVFIGESDRLDGKPLYEAIVRKTRELGVAGATVLRGTEGFGAHSVIHKAHLLEMSSDLPVVIEIVDSADKIHALVPHLDGMVTEGMITMENVRILAYRGGGGGGTPVTPRAGDTT